MIPVDQQIIVGDGSGRLGDCLRACVASQLDLAAEAVPHFIENDDWVGSIVDFVNDRGFNFRWVEPATFPVTEPDAPSTCIAVGMSPRNLLHAVIVDSATGSLIHDPHPSRDGLAEPAKSLIVFTRTA